MKYKVKYKWLILCASILLIISFVVYCMFVGNPIKKHHAIAKSIEYMDNQYPDIDYEVVDSFYYLDSGIYGALLKNKTGEEFDFKVELQTNGIYDTYYTSIIEFKSKKMIYEEIKNYVDYKNLDVYFDNQVEYSKPLEELSKDILEATNYIVINYDKRFSKEELAEESSLIIKQIYDTIPNVSSYAFRCYYKEKELFFMIDQSEIKNGYTSSDIKKYILEQDIIHDVSE